MSALLTQYSDLKEAVHTAKFVRGTEQDLKNAFLALESFERRHPNVVKKAEEIANQKWEDAQDW